MASRHKSRSIAIQGLYQIELTKTPVEEVVKFQWYDKKLGREERDLAELLINGVVKNWEVLDNIIKAYSRGKELDRISIINRNILRISIFSLVNMREIPGRIIINEALELTREFESEESLSLINGILDSVYRDELAKSSGGD